MDSGSMVALSQEVKGFVGGGRSQGSHDTLCPRSTSRGWFWDDEMGVLSEFAMFGDGGEGWKS